MAEAICTRCGEEKSAPWERCTRCNLDPTLDVEILTKSVYLSAGRFSDATDQARYRLELDAMKEPIHAGEAVAFAPAELARLKAQLATLKSTEPSTAWMALIRLFLPAVMLLGFLLVLAYIIPVVRQP